MFFSMLACGHLSSSSLSLQEKMDIQGFCNPEMDVKVSSMRE